MTKENLIYKDYLPNIKNFEFFQEYLNLLEPYIISPIPKTEKTQTHHIVFKCYLETAEQKRDKRNLVELPQNVHVRAHILFWKAVRDRKSCWACYRFRESERKSNITPEESEELLVQFRKESSKVHKGKKLSEEHRKILSISNSGKEMSSETRNKISKKQKGRHLKENQTSMYDSSSGHWHWVSNEEVEQKLKEGWVKGRGPMPMSQRKNLKIAFKGRKNKTKGAKTIHQGELIKMVRPEDLEHYLNEGWELGRIKGKKGRPLTDEEKKRVSKRFKGTHFSESHRENHEKAMRKSRGIKIEKDGQIFYSWKYELLDFLNQGWRLV